MKVVKDQKIAVFLAPQQIELLWVLVNEDEPWTNERREENTILATELADALQDAGYNRPIGP